MSVGLRVRDENTNRVTLEITDSLTKLLGSVMTGAQNGSINVPEFATNRPWASVPIIYQNNPLNFGAQCVVTISGTTLSWVYYSAQGDQPRNTKITYGIY